MQTIWKYDIANEDFEHEMPQGATILSVQSQKGRGVFWALVDPDAEKETRNFLCVGTGWKITSFFNLSYLGTYQDGFLVWHLFEEE